MRNLWIDNGSDHNKKRSNPEMEKEISKFLNQFNKEETQIEIVLTGDLAGKVIIPKKGKFPTKWDISNSKVSWSKHEKSIFDYTENTIIATHKNNAIKIIKGKVLVAYFYKGENVYL